MRQITDIQTSIVSINTKKTVTKNGGASPTKPAGNGKKKHQAALPVHKTKNVTVSSTVNNAVVQVNNFLQSQNRGLEFTVDKSTGKTLIKVVDRTNGKILRQIPPKYIVRLAQTLHYPGQVSSTGIKTKA